MKKFKIEDRYIGLNEPVFIIAEAGVNHNGSLEMAIRMVDVAIASGADAIKFQTFTADEISTKNAPKAAYHIRTTGDDDAQSWYSLLKSQELSYDDHVQLIKYCKNKNIIFLSTPYSRSGVDMLYELGVSAFKIASTDLNNLPFLEYVANKKRPMIISTAMSEMREVSESIKCIRAAGLEDIVVMQCTGNYPADVMHSNLRVIDTYRKEFGCLVGFSDHTLDFINPIAATALGACVYEKHFTLDRSLPGPDHPMSLTPDELLKTVCDIRATEGALGSATKFVLETELDNRKKLRKSLVACDNFPVGTLITEDMIGIKRPGTGMEPRDIKLIIGRRLIKGVVKDQLIEVGFFE